MNKTITKNLRKLRQGKRLTQEYVAERLGVSAKAVSRWEKGDSTPDIENKEIHKMVKILFVCHGRISPNS